MTVSSYNKNLLFVFLMVGVIAFSCNNIRDNQTFINDNNFDTNLILSQKSNKFEFNILEVSGEASDTNYLCFVRLVNSGKSYFLFETIQEFSTKDFEHLYDSYYAFPYWTGGNYCRAVGINVLKITPDTAIFLGPLSGYDDIDDNGTNELFIEVVIESDGAHTDEVIEKLEVFIENDSLRYQMIDLY